MLQKLDCCKATAVAMAQPGYGNSVPLHLDIDSEMLVREGGVDALVSLIHTHNHMGGTLINLNCLTKEKLLLAHENPDKYPDLLVRVTGYSAFFASLSKDYRQQIVDRFLSRVGWFFIWIDNQECVTWLSNYYTEIDTRYLCNSLMLISFLSINISYIRHLWVKWGTYIYKLLKFTWWWVLALKLYFKAYVLIFSMKVE